MSEATDVKRTVGAAFDHFPEQLIRNAWTKTGYAQFCKLEEDIEEEENDRVGEEDNKDEDEDELVLRMVWNGNMDTSNGLDEGEEREDDIGGDINGIMATVCILLLMASWQNEIMERGRIVVVRWTISSREIILLLFL